MRLPSDFDISRTFQTCPMDCSPHVSNSKRQRHSSPHPSRHASWFDGSTALHGGRSEIQIIEDAIRSHSDIHVQVKIGFWLVLYLPLWTYSQLRLVSLFPIYGHHVDKCYQMFHKPPISFHSSEHWRYWRYKRTPSLFKNIYLNCCPSVNSAANEVGKFLTGSATGPGP